MNATHTVKAGETKDVTAQFDLPAEQVRLWHFDHPELYHLQTTLTVSGEVEHAVSDRFGIRKIELSATEFRLNGEPVRLVGFNRVADDAGPSGNTEPEELVHADVDLMKRAGANMQRIMCVPQATSLLNRLDEKGMMIIVGIPDWGKDPQTTVVDNPLTKQWMREMIERDYNHPSIIGYRSWGVVDQHRTLKPAYYTIRKLHSPVEILKVDGVTATVKTRPLSHIPSYTLKGYKLKWEKGEQTGEIPLPTLKPGDPAWTGDLPVAGATLRLVTPLGYDIDDNIDRSSFSDGVGIVLDDSGAEFVGTWKRSNKSPKQIAVGYRFSGTPDQPHDGSATATYRFTAPKAGQYRLDMAYSPDPTRAPNVPVTVTSGASTANFSVNQQTALDNGSYREIGTVTLVQDQETVITIGTVGTTGFVIADAIRFVPVSEP